MLVPYSGRNPRRRVRQTLRFRSRNRGGAPAGEARGPVISPFGHLELVEEFVQER